jgi:outer membrane protein TolC
MGVFQKCRIHSSCILRGKGARDRSPSRRLGVAAVLLFSFLAAGCSFWHHRSSLSTAVINKEVKSRVLVPPDLNVTPAETVARPDPPGPPPSDPAPESYPEPEPDVFSLPRAIAYALRNNPRLLSARAAIERARGQEQVAFSPFLPQVDFLVQFGDTSFNQGPGAVGRSGYILTSGVGNHFYGQEIVQVQQLVCDFGRTGGRWRQAVAREKIAELQLVRADQTVAFDVATSYMNVLLARASRRVQEDAIRLAESILSDTQVRRKGGTVDRDAILRAEVQLAFSRSGLVQARETELDALAHLNNILGRNAAYPLQVLDLESPPVSPPILTELLAKAAEQRPEIGLARQVMVVANEGLRAIRGGFLPNIYVRGSAGRVDGSNILTGWQEGVGLHFETPLYQGGRLRGELRAAEADVRSALADAQAIMDNISLDVSLAYRRVMATAELIELARVAVVQAEDDVNLVRTKYRGGNATPTDVVEVETARTRAQQNLYSAIYSQLAALARLSYALGLPQDAFLGKATTPAEEKKSAPEELPRPRKLPEVK